jgi:tetratricopeptide (TPR) repeat protein
MPEPALDTVSKSSNKETNAAMLTARKINSILSLLSWLGILGLALIIGGCGHKTAADWIEAGNSARQNSRLGDAESDYRAAIAADSTDPRPHLALGQLYAFEKKPDLAEAEFMKAVELAPNDGSAHAALGGSYAERAELGPAENQYRAAIVLAPANADFRMALGDILQRAHKNGVAEAEYRTAIGLQPKNAHAHLALANLLSTESSRQEEAQAEFAEVRALDPSLAAAPAAVPAVATAPAAAGAPAPPAKLREINKRFVLTHDSPVYQSASGSSPVVGQVHHRKVVHITGMAGDWFRVQLKNGTVGYIPVTAAE